MKKEKHIVVPKNHYTTKMFWNEIARSEGIGGVLGVRILQAVEIDNVYTEKEVKRRAEKIIKEVPKEQIPDLKKVLNELTKLSDYCNAWADMESYVKRDDEGCRTDVDLEHIPFTKYKHLYGDWGEVWLDGYERAVHDIHNRIGAVKMLAEIYNIAKSRGYRK